MNLLFSRKETPTTGGIYKIECLANGRVYVGSSSNLRQRLVTHLTRLRAGHHDNRLVQRAWAKYGEESFRASIVEHVADEQDLLDRETYWMAHLKAPVELGGFNLVPADRNIPGYTLNLTDEQRQRRAENAKRLFQNPEARAQASASRRETMKCPLMRAKMGLGRKGISHTPEVQALIAQKVRRPYIVISPEGEVRHIKGVLPFCREQFPDNPKSANAQLLQVSKGGASNFRGWRMFKPNHPNIEAHAIPFQEPARWRVTEPSGTAVEVVSLDEYARQKGLHSGSLHATAKGRYHKGYLVESLTEYSATPRPYVAPHRQYAKQRGRSFIWIITEPDGAIVEVINASEYCQARGLNIGCLSAIASGKRTIHKGYKATRRYLD